MILKPPIFPSDSRTHTHRIRSTWHNLCTCIQRDTRTLTRANTLTTKWRIKTTTLTPTTHTPLFRPNGRVPRSHRSNSHALVHSIAGRARKRVLRPSYVYARNQWKVIHMKKKMKKGRGKKKKIFFFLQKLLTENLHERPHIQNIH